MSLDQDLIKASFDAVSLGVEKARAMYASKYASVFAALEIGKYVIVHNLEKMGVNNDNIETQISEIWSTYVVEDARWETRAAFGACIGLWYLIYL